MQRIVPAAALAALLQLAACSSEPADPPTVTVTQTTVAEEPGEADAAAPPTQQAQPDTSDIADSCAQLPKDPREAYPSGSAPGRMPADDGSDYNYWIEDIDNAYDPCAPLSWIIFRGSLGDEHHRAGTAASVADGLALYIDGKPAGEMKLFGRIDNITPLDGGGAAIEWSERGQYTADGYVNHYSAELRAADGAITAVAGDAAKFHESWDYPISYLLGTYD